MDYETIKYYKYVPYSEEINMPGRIMTALQAENEYGRRFKSVKKKGNTITLKNSSGKTRDVGKNSKVYHRGKGNFAEYSTKRDSTKISRGATSLGGKGAVGSGGYRHTSDYRRTRRR